MKLIGTLFGTSVLRVSTEDASPQNGIPWPDLIAALNSRYKFAAATQPPLTVPIQPSAGVIFQNGEMEVRDGKVSVNQLNISSAGVAAVANKTEIADAILDDVVSVLDKSFGFKISRNKPKRQHLSDVVVEFDRGIETYLKAISKIETLITRSTSKKENLSGEFKIKRLVFGREGFDTPNLQTDNLDAIDTIEFIIERRVKHPYSDNRYYSRAPMRSDDHIATLELIEKAFRK